MFAAAGIVRSRIKRHVEHADCDDCPSRPGLSSRIILLDVADVRIAAALMLVAGIVLPLIPGYPGFACPLRMATGVPCPLCGMSTSVQETLRLRFQEAFNANPAGLVAVIVAGALVMLRPKRVPVPVVVVPVALAAMWVFQLFRFDVL